MSHAPQVKRTPLYDIHLEEGARIVPFAGWEMPIQYKGGIRQEHLFVRSDAGLFDVSHMGQINLHGPDSLSFLQHLLPRDLNTMQIGQLAYAVMCTDRGGVVDDLAVYKLGEERYLLVVNASRLEEDVSWITRQVEFRPADRLSPDPQWAVDVSVVADAGMLALQGPRAEEMVTSLFGKEMRDLGYFHFVELDFNSERILVSRSGYTGEDGFEIICTGGATLVSLWRQLRLAGAAATGLGARDTLRTEMGYALYGQELDAQTTPVEAGLGWTLAPEKEMDFVGQAALRAALAAGPRRRLRGLVAMDRGIPRPGSSVVADDRAIGLVSSGTFSPSLEKGIALAFIERPYDESGAQLHLEMRGRLWPVQVHALPFLPSKVKATRRRSRGE